MDDPAVRAGFHNLSLTTTPEDLVRSVFEGTAYNSRWLLDAVERFVGRQLPALAFIGGLLGSLGGIGYARAMLHGLTTLWSDAVGGSALKFFVTPGTLVIGLLASTVVAVFTLWLALRKQARQPARA